MTREEWLTSADSAAVLQWALVGPHSDGVGVGFGRARGVSDRKLLLFAAACCRLIQPSRRAKERWPHFLLAVDELEKSADGIEADAVLLDTFFRRDWDAPTLARWSAKGVKEAAALLRDIVGDPFEPVTLPTCRRCDGDGEAHGSDRPFDWHGSGTWPGPCPACEGRRWDAPWVTPQVLSLAQAAYEDRLPDGTLDPFRFALLADALEEAGCPAEMYTIEKRDLACGRCQGTGRVVEAIGTPYDPPDFGTCNACGGKKTTEGVVKVVRPHPLLAHLRSPGPHFRGCHVVDLILAKQ